MIVVFVMKFAGGAWALAIVIPLIMLFMLYTHRHYVYFGKALSIEGYHYHYKESQSRDMLPCVVLIHNMNRALLKTVDYAKDISSDLVALHITSASEQTEELKKQWEELKIKVPLVVIPAPYRDILPPLDQYITERESKLAHGQRLTVVLTKFVGGGWRDDIFHNQTTFFIESKLVKHKDVVTVLVPYLYRVKGEG